MNIHTTKLALSNDRVPQGHTLIGWINRHPSDPEGREQAYAVLRTPAGVEVAWEGTPTMRRLPRDWRELVTFEAAD